MAKFKLLLFSHHQAGQYLVERLRVFFGYHLNLHQDDVALIGWGGNNRGVGGIHPATAAP